MRVRLNKITVITRQTIEVLEFSSSVTFLYGPLGTGKSTVARLIDYCFGADLERTPAIQKEFVSVKLSVELGSHVCILERSASDTQFVRVSWSRGMSGVKKANISSDFSASEMLDEGLDDLDLNAELLVGNLESNAIESADTSLTAEFIESVNAPLDAGDAPIIEEDVYNLSDLLFHLCDVVPIKVRKRSRDPDSPMIRLSFRDIWWYCYLDQTHLDSSFFRLEDPFRGRKSQDAMRFFTGLHSERLSHLETNLYRAIDEQRGKREAANQVRQFMVQFELSSEIDLAGQIEKVQRELSVAESRRAQLEEVRDVAVHPTEPLKQQLRTMSFQISELTDTIRATDEAIVEQRALRAELITTKVKADRTEQAGRLLADAGYDLCPECATDISRRATAVNACKLCGSSLSRQEPPSSLEMEVLRRELNDRIDQIGDSIQRRERNLGRSVRQLEQLQTEKVALDKTLQHELARYDSAYVESVRAQDREIATLTERLRSLAKLRKMPQAITELEEQAGALQLEVDRLRSSIEAERSRLRQADENVAAIADCFKSIMLLVGFPGVTKEDKVVIDPRDWRPVIFHEGQEWTFGDAGSSGKKTLFNVCYALALHQTAQDRGMPVPDVLVIDSPTKNISDEENPDLIKALYREIYRLASRAIGKQIQFLLIDSDLVKPEIKTFDFEYRHMAGKPDAPSLIPYYSGP